MAVGGPTSAPSKGKAAPPRRGVQVSLHVQGAAAILTVSGLIDEGFQGFGSFPDETQTLVIDVSKVTRMTSFGVRQWLKAMDGLPRRLTDLYMIGCPTFVVDQMNMVLNFGGAAKVLTVQAPFVCTGCGAESSDRLIDVMAHRSKLMEGTVPEQTCTSCSAILEFDEAPESFFALVSKYGATQVSVAAAEILATFGLYQAPDREEEGEEKAPKIFKIVQDSVTYFKISGVLGRAFRSRPLAVGAEGEVVLDVSEVTRFTQSGQREWDRLIRHLSTQVNAITVVDVGEPMLQAAAAGFFRITKHFTVWSIIARYTCASCGKQTQESIRLAGHAMRLDESRVCPSCGGTTTTELPRPLLAPLGEALTQNIPAASTRFIDNRTEIISRVMVEASIARGSDGGVDATTSDTILGKYRIVKPISAGGMAEVFLAKQVGIGGFEKTVALKRILRSFLENRHLAVDLFLNEAKIAARLVHPNIVQVLDVGEDRGSLYLAMEYVHGCDLRVVSRALKQRREQRLPVPEVLYIAREVANALHHAYYSADLEGKQNNVVHRDVSPHNILLSYEGAVKLSDFGVAASAVTTDRESLVTGKWAYMSPEQTLGQKLDHRSDLFSLGIVLYQLLAGTHPFGANNVGDLIVKLRRGDMMPLRDRRQDLPETLTILVDRLLSLSPEERPRHGQAVATAITDIARSARMELRPEGLATILGTLFVDSSRQSTPPPNDFYYVKQSATPTPSTATPSTRQSQVSSVTDSGVKTTLSAGPPDYQVDTPDDQEDISKSFPLREVPDDVRAVEIDQDDDEMPPPLPQFTRERVTARPASGALRSSTLFVLTVLIVVGLSVAAYLVLGPVVRGMLI
jgi:eukaryotic-like serine/threonine-protein kinase